MKAINIVIFGYGKMGKAIEEIALKRGNKIGLIIDINNVDSITTDDLKAFDVAIDFSIPSSVISNIYKCFEANLPIVVGTTGWNDSKTEIENYCTKNKKTMFHSSNYSIGVNIFAEVNKKLATMMKSYSQYEISMQEIHHIHKLDQPSGTAISLAEQIIERVGSKNTWVNEPAKKNNELFIESIREGEVPGTHIIKYESEVDMIEIKHEAFNRHGLALGAVIAAEWLHGKTGVFGMSQLLNIL